MGSLEPEAHMVSIIIIFNPLKTLSKKKKKKGKENKKRKGKSKAEIKEDEGEEKKKDFVHTSFSDRNKVVECCPTKALQLKGLGFCWSNTFG